MNRRFESREAVKEYLKDNELETQFIIRATGKGNVYYEVISNQQSKFKLGPYTVFSRVVCT